MRGTPSAELTALLTGLLDLCAKAKASLPRADALYLKNTVDMLRGRSSDQAFLAMLRAIQ